MEAPSESTEVDRSRRCRCRRRGGNSLSDLCAESGRSAEHGSDSCCESAIRKHSRGASVVTRSGTRAGTRTTRDTSSSPTVTAALTRSSFTSGLGFALDAFQTSAFDSLDAGKSVLVAAPTGSGKTLVADYAIASAISSGAKAFYTTPLKALSNQKYGDLVRAHGSENVGLLTGDNTINGDALVVVMTTEVLRNMIYARSKALNGLRYVILDEVHYLQDRSRGPVWEEVIIHLPPSVDLVCLSATVSNAEEFAEWIRSVRGQTVAVIEERRPVELTNLYAVAMRDGSLNVLETFARGHGGELIPNPDAARLLGRSQAHRGAHVSGGRRRSPFSTPRRVEVIEWLAEHDLLPAITFIFSRAGCDSAVARCVSDGVTLTNPTERSALRRIADEHTEQLLDEDLNALDYDRWLMGFEAGIAAHHAGMVPPLKEAVEQAFNAGLVKAVFATETLSLGINMPARSVVIEKLSKFTGTRHESLTPGEYTQFTGRAGRRGIDDRGYAVVLWNPFATFEQVASLASRRTPALRSSFRPTYNMTANLVARCNKKEAHHLLGLSFAQYQVDRAAESRQEKGAPDNRAQKRLNAKRADLGQQLDLVLGVLEACGFVDDWTLTPRGQVLRRIFSECDLLIAQAITDGLLDDLDSAELAAVVSLFTFEQRGRDTGDVLPHWPTGKVAKRAGAIERLWRALNILEVAAGIPETRCPDPGLAFAVHRWAKGQSLGSVLEDEDELTGGDFVRNIKQVTDVLRQIAEVSLDPRTASIALSSADACFRGVVCATSLVQP